MLSVKSDAVAGDTAVADTVSVTASVETALKRRGHGAVEPSFSAIEDEPRANDTVRASSSVIVRVLADGASTPLPPETVALTVTSFSGPSTALLTAVTVTVPVLLVVPAAMVRVLLVLRLKSDEVVGDTAVAATVSVTASVETALSVAVTAVEPPFSAIDAEPRARETVRVSSSVIERVLSDGASTPLPPETVALTVTSFSGPSTALFTPVIVTVPVLLVVPAAMVRVLAVLSVKSEDVAGDTAVAETVSVTASVETALSVAVTAA